MKNTKTIDDVKIKTGQALEVIPVLADNGWGYDKVVFSDKVDFNSIKEFAFKSNIAMNEEAIYQENTFVVNGRKINTTSNTKAVVHAKKEHILSKNNKYTIANLHRALYSVSKATNFKTTKFFAGIGCSLDTFKDKELVEKLREEVLKETKLEIEYEGNKVVLEIVGVSVQPETVCSAFVSKQYDPSRTCVLIDLGTLNSQLITLMANGAPDILGSRTRDFGYHSIVTALEGEYRKSEIKRTSLQIEEAIELIARGYEQIPSQVRAQIEDIYRKDKKTTSEDKIKMEKDIEKQTKRMINKYLEENDLLKEEEIINNFVVNNFLKGIITEELNEMNTNLNRDKLIFTGGTSHRFRKQILEVFPRATFVEDPFFANAKGMYARMMNEYKLFLNENKVAK